nr:LysR family transcriptional regulator [Rhodoferax sp.]
MNLLSSMRYLVALNEHRHFARAAEACHITQPALSNALRALEAEFSVVIVRRGRTFAGLTPEGEQVLAAGQRMLHEQQVLQQSLKSTEHSPAGGLVIGAVPTAVPIAARFAAMLQARHPLLMPVVLSLSSSELEARLDNLSIDLGLGYTERMAHGGAKLQAVQQYIEHYFLLRRASVPHPQELQIGESISWQSAAQQPLCLLTPEMHNRTIVNAAFASAGCAVTAIIETNSILTMALSVVAGQVCSVMPGALVAAVRGYRELEALPLVSPQVRTPIGFMRHAQARASRAMEAALALAEDGHWLRHAATHSGLMVA